MMQKLDRRQSFQTIAWFRDLYKRGLLNLDPPYQRRSVWNQKYREFFIETILLQYPAPAIFVHEEISPDGTVQYSVVDGKQRLTTIFDFAEDLFPVADDSALTPFQNLTFSELDDQTRKDFWTYQFSVEYLPTTNPQTLTNVFDRINRNVSRLTRQELRHARYSGEFSTTSERLNDFLFSKLQDVPHIAPASKRQMKDVELTAQLMLLIENGIQSFSQDDLDVVYSERDTEWELSGPTEETFRNVVHSILELLSSDECGPAMRRRLRNQMDFYSTFAVYADFEKSDTKPDPDDTARILTEFFDAVSTEESRSENGSALRYYDATRSASNDLRQRVTRSSVLFDVIQTGKAG
ncbi:hypothetical protein GCM10027068_46190 [Prescottella soli]